MFAGILLLSALYLGNLTGMGLILPDEPRYADIGRAMARTGDWVTPRLWGVPWFEKPALLYWMTGLGFRMGLGPETAPRLPVAGEASQARAWCATAATDTVAVELRRGGRRPPCARLVRLWPL